MDHNVVAGPGSSAAISSVIRGCADGMSRRLRTAIVVSGGFDARPWSASILGSLSGSQLCVGLLDVLCQGARAPASSCHALSHPLTLRRNRLATLDEIPYPQELVVRDALTYPRVADNPRALGFTSLIRLLSRH